MVEMTNFKTVQGFYILNAIRVGSIISLVTAVVASWATLVKSFVATTYYVFDVCTQVFISAFCVFLLISELSLLERYLKRNWPLFSRNASLVPLGIGEIFVGSFLLGNLNENFASKDTLGNAFNSLLMGAGVVVLVFGIVTFLASFTFTSPGWTARMIRSFKQRKLAKERTQRLPNASSPSNFRKICSPELREVGSRGSPSFSEPAYPLRAYSFRTHQKADIETVDGYGNECPSADTASVYSRTEGGRTIYDGYGPDHGYNNQ